MVVPAFLESTFLVRTAANCNVLIADRMSLPVAEHREDSEETVRAEERNRAI